MTHRFQLLMSTVRNSTFTAKTSMRREKDTEIGNYWTRHCLTAVLLGLPQSKKFTEIYSMIGQFQWLTNYQVFDDNFVKQWSHLLTTAETVNQTKIYHSSLWKKNYFTKILVSLALDFIAIMRISFIRHCLFYCRDSVMVILFLLYSTLFTLFMTVWRSYFIFYIGKDVRKHTMKTFKLQSTQIHSHIYL